jgi:hypothetical protein
VSHLFPFISSHFPLFPTIPGNSMRHARDMHTATERFRKVGNIALALAGLLLFGYVFTRGVYVGINHDAQHAQRPPGL